MTKTFHFASRPEKSLIGLFGKDKVQVLTDVYSYDGFDLIVDLGSSLGLWLGASAISILDLTIGFFHRLQ